MAAGAAALALYCRTLRPDFGGPEDSPKFQFLGAVLGTAHQPGYPLYVLLSWLFIKAPLGSIAYRVNVMSAVGGAAVVLVTTIAARRLGLGAFAASVAVVGLATGVKFWWYSVNAEVYALAALLTVVAVLAVLDWGRSPRPGRLLVAAFAAGLAAAFHPVAYGILPGCALYLFALGGRRVLRPSVLLGAALAFLAGYLPYLFVLVRTWHPGPYLESTASNLSELIGVMRFERAAHTTFRYDAATLLFERLPRVAGIVVREMTWVGVVLVLAGLTRAVRRRDRNLGFVAIAALGMLGPILDTSGEASGFVVIVIPLLWLLAAAGADSVLTWRRVSPALRRVGALALLVLMSSVGLVGNWSQNDLSQRRAESRFFRGMYDELPPGSAFVFENYWIEMMRLYPVLAEGAGRERRIRTHSIPKIPERIRAALSAGPVFVFDPQSRYLRSLGFRLKRQPVREDDLDAFLRALPSSAVVAVVAAERELPVAFERFGEADTPGPSGRRLRPRRFAGAILAGGRRVASGADDASLRLEFVTGAGSTGGSRAPVTVGVRAGPDGMRIDADGGPVVEARSGLLIAVVDEAGRLLTSDDFGAGDAVRPERLTSAPRLWRVEAAGNCVQVGPMDWTDITHAARWGAVGGLVRPGRSITFEIRTAGSRFLWPTLTVPFGNAKARLEPIDTPPPTGADLTGSPRAAWRATITNGPRVSSFRLQAGGLPVTAVARVETSQPGGAVELCGAEPVELGAAGASGEVDIPVGEAGDLYFAAGWRAPEGPQASGVRWTAGDLSSLVVPIEHEADHVLTLEAQPGIEGAILDLYVNGVRLGERELTPGWQEAAWAVPGRLLHRGPNEIGVLHRRSAVVRDYARSTTGRPGWAVRHVHVRPLIQGAHPDNVAP